MPRVKRGTTKNKRRKYLLAKTKGARNSIKSKKRRATEAILHAGKHSFNDRRKKKNMFRRLWNVRIGAASKSLDTSYSKLIGSLGKANITLNRKVLSELAQKNPETFSRIVEKTKQTLG